VENKIIINNQVITYVIIRKPIKNIYFRFKSDLILYVSCNRMVSERYIINLLNEQASNILKMYDKMQKKQTPNDLYYLGDKLNLIISNTKPFINNDDIYAKSMEEAKKYLYTLSLSIFETRLKQIRHNFDYLPEFRLRVRHMTTRWGVCNRKSMTVTLNTELITKDVNLIDYVIIHELCHFKYMNHSSSFWNEVGKHYPYYKLARKELNY
jgi:predicted metal-dependent hydrolase